MSKYWSGISVGHGRFSSYGLQSKDHARFGVLLLFCSYCRSSPPSPSSQPPFTLSPSLWPFLASSSPHWPQISCYSWNPLVQGWRTEPSSLAEHNRPHSGHLFDSYPNYSWTCQHRFRKLSSVGAPVIQCVHSSILICSLWGHGTKRIIVYSQGAGFFFPLWNNINTSTRYTITYSPSITEVRPYRFAYMTWWSGICLRAISLFLM